MTDIEKYDDEDIAYFNQVDSCIKQIELDIEYDTANIINIDKEIEYLQKRKTLLQESIQIDLGRISTVRKRAEAYKESTKEEKPTEIGVSE